MNSKKRILSLIMAVLMFITFVPAQTFANTSNFVEPKQNVVNGHKEGDKLVFDVLTAKNPRRYKQQANGFSLFRAGEAEIIDQKVTVNLKALGLKESADSFDWSLLPSSGLKVTVYFSNQRGMESEKKEVILKQGALSQTVTLRVPANGGTGKLHAEIPYLDNNLAIRVIRTGEDTSKTVGSGDWSFDVQVSEITSPVIKLEVKDPYGKPAPAAGDVQAKLHVDGLEGSGLDVPFTISQGKDSFNLKEAELLNGKDYDVTELNYPGDKPTLTIEDEKQGKLTLGTGTDAVEYKVTKEYDIKKGGTITLTSQPDAVVPPTKNDGITPVDLPADSGYTRLTFDANEVKQDGVKGTFTNEGPYQGKQLSYIDVKDGVGYNNKTLKKLIDALTVKGTKEEKQNPTTPWDPKVPDSGIVKDGTNKKYNAKYKALVVPGEEQPKKPGTEEPDTDYVQVKFDANDGAFDPADAQTSYWVLKKSTIANIKAYKEVPAGKTAEEVVFKIPTAKKDGQEYTAWKAKVGAATEVGATAYAKDLKDYQEEITEKVEFVAQYKKVVVPGEEQPKKPGTNDPDDDYVQIKFNANDGAFDPADAQTSYWVLKKSTIANIKAYKEVPAGKTAEEVVFKIPTAKKDGQEYTAWTEGTKDYAKDLSDYATEFTANVTTFKAKYEAGTTPSPSYNYITLTLDENYRGGRISDYDVYQGELIERYLYTPRRRGYVFEGWSYNSRRLDEVRPGDGIYYPTTLYAIWSKQKPKDDEDVEPVDTREVGEHKAYMFGYTDGTVRPNGYITRAEAAALVTRLLGLDTFASAAEPAFTDTPSSWYNKAINAAVARGIMKGYPDKSFRPNAPITRAEFTQMISTIDNKPYGVAPFADVVGHWAERPIGSEYQAGRIKGYPDGTFRPNAFITRAEAVVILNKIFERSYDAMSAKDAVNAHLIKGFYDLPTSFWGYYDMIEATNSHSFKRRSEGKVQEDWTLVK